MPDQHDQPLPNNEPDITDPGAMEWLYDTLDETSPQRDPRGGRGFPWFSLLALLLGIAALAVLGWLLLGSPPFAAPVPTPVSTVPPSPVLPTPLPTDQTSIALSPLPTPAEVVTQAVPFEIGDRVVITGTGTRGLRLRAGAGLGFLTREVFKDGDAFFVLGLGESDGEYPVRADGYLWWRLRSPEGMTGWTVEDFLVPAPLVAETVTPAP